MVLERFLDGFGETFGRSLGGLRDDGKRIGLIFAPLRFWGEASLG